MVNKADEALNAPAVELIRAASRPATTRPRMPAGMTFTTMSGNAACATSGIARPSGPTIAARPGARPVFASARAMRPGMMKMNTGSSFEHAAQLVPAPEGPEPEQCQEAGAAHQNDRLECVGVGHRAHAAEHRVQPRHEHDQHRPDPETVEAVPRDVEL